MEEEKVQIFYWPGLKARAHVINFIAGWTGESDKIIWNPNGVPAYPGTPEFDSFPTKSAWDALPYMEHGKVKIGQSMAIVQYLSRWWGFGGAVHSHDFALSQQAISASYDMYNILSKLHYSITGTCKERFDTAFGDNGEITKNLAIWNSLISETTGWVSTTTPHAQPGDLCLAAMCSIIVDLQSDALDKFGKLKRLHETVQAKDGIKEVERLNPTGYFKRE